MGQYGESQQARPEEQAVEGGVEQAPGIDPAELVRAAADFARENPHTALGGAFAVGFLLGGGLTPRILASIAMFAGRKVLAEAARDALQGAVQQQLDEMNAA